MVDDTSLSPHSSTSPTNLAPNLSAPPASISTPHRLIRQPVTFWITTEKRGFLEAMAPPTPTYPVSALPTEINTLANGKARKPPIKNLKDCALKEMVQYKCNVQRPNIKGGEPIILCDPVVRMFRV
jgi:hypothetical protein